MPNDLRHLVRVVTEVVEHAKANTPWSYAMPRFRKLGVRSIVMNGAVLLAAAFALASCGTPGHVSSTAQSNRAPIATAYLPASSVCGTNGDYVQQSLTGDFTGCFRVPSLHSSSLIVALQSYLMGRTTTGNGPTTIVSAPAPTGHVSLSLSSKIATPGEVVAITGHFLSRPPPAPLRQTSMTICWDGCQTGLQEQGAPVRWTSATTFHTNLLVPKTAWLVARDGAVIAHPLQSGSYQVGVQCIELTSGCALGPADAQTTIQLKAPRPTKCLSGQPCETMTLSTSKAAVGDEVIVKGWAPLQSIIGQPFGYSLSVTTGSTRRQYPALSFTQSLKGGGFNVVLTPRVLRVSPSQTWATLGHVPYRSSSFAGPSPIDPASGSKLIAWCQPSGLEITGGPTPINVPTGAVAVALRGTGLSLFPSTSSNEPCSSVLLDPLHASSIFASFGTATNNSAPPLYFAGLYTTDAGVNWRTIPTPAGMTLEDFAGFTTSGDRVEALFANANNYQAQFPPGTNHGLVAAEVTSNGGASWSATTLGCPSTGPCTTFGPDQWGNCAMNGSFQLLLQGTPDVGATSGVKWTSSWPPSVNSCYSPQLVVTSPHDLLLLDASSQYSLMRSTNSGQSWTYISIPSIAAANYGPDSIPLGNSLLFAPDGSLFSVITASSGLRQELFRLAPGAAKWCQVPRVFGVSASSGTVGSLRARGMDLIWNQNIYPSSGAPTSSMHVVPLASLRC